MAGSVPRTARGASTHKLLGLLLLVSFVFGQAYVGMHHALVEHHVCAVGGELVHGGHGHGDHVSGDHHADGAVDHEAQPASADQPDGPRVVGSESEPEHGDECSIPTSRSPRRYLAFAPTVRIRPAVVAVRASSAPGTRALASRVPIFLLAPKQSPPQPTYVG